MKYYDNCCECDSIEPVCESYFSCNELYNTNNHLPTLISEVEKLSREEGKVDNPVRIKKPEDYSIFDHNAKTVFKYNEVAHKDSVIVTNSSNESIDASSIIIIVTYNILNSYYYNHFIMKFIRHFFIFSKLLNFNFFVLGICYILYVFRWIKKKD
ncbi:variable surface protein [Plasmodium gonderi]|uniref:Variable surface protein n=1 Tax=Plasmodium gonderi TaxID=77519 RepID=A0A1Y1JQG0_PLAGO|nr:variable surface protein [Plasmodium gonderi]GAW84741.1 variable surface protein [Plasmodium gonderi]